MAMPRPSGKAKKIAQQVIPGLRSNGKGSSLKKRKAKKIPNDEVEMKIVDINEHLGKDPHSRTSSGFGVSS